MRNLITAILMTAVTTVLFGLIYPLAVTGIARELLTSCSASLLALVGTFSFTVPCSTDSFVK
jgi:K+-transporting ATPase c subunit